MHRVQVKSVYILTILLETCLMLVLVKILALPLKSCITFEVSFSDFRFLTCKVMIKKKLCLLHGYVVNKYYSP